MTALQAGLIGSAMSMAGAPAVLLHAFFNSAPERLILKKCWTVYVHIVSACVLMVLTGFFIHFFLPGNWQWVQWVNIATFVLTLLMCVRRYRVWRVCRNANDELSLDDLGTVVTFAYKSLRHNVTMEANGKVYLRVTIHAFIEVTRRFKITGMDAQTVLNEMAHRAHQAATPSDTNPHPKVQYERDGLDTAPVRVIKMMYDPHSKGMNVYVN